MKTKLFVFLFTFAALVSVRAQDFKLDTAQPVDVITVTTQRVQRADLRLSVFKVLPDAGVIVGQADYGPGTKAYPVVVTNAALAKKLTAMLVKEIKPQVEVGVTKTIELEKLRAAQAVKQRAALAAKREAARKAREAQGTNTVSNPNP